MNNKNNYDELEMLTALDDDIVEEISCVSPILDEAAKKRIENLFREKTGLDFSEKNLNNYDLPFENVKRINHIPWYRKPSFTIAASIILIFGSGIMTALAFSEVPNSKPAPDYQYSTTTAAETSAETMEVHTIKTAIEKTTEVVTFETEPITDADTEKITDAPIASETKSPDVTSQTEETAVTQQTEAPTVSETIVTTEASSEPETPPYTTDNESEQKPLITNGYNIYDYPAYVDQIKNTPSYIYEHYLGYTGDDDVAFGLTDLNNDDHPELLIFIDTKLRFAYSDDNALNLPDGNLQSLIMTNLSCNHVLCKNGIILTAQGNPPYIENTFLYYDGSGNMKPIETIVTDRGSLTENVESVTDDNVDIGNIFYYIHETDDIYIDYNTIEEHRISKEEADEIISKYDNEFIETIPITEIIK